MGKRFFRHTKGVTRAAVRARKTKGVNGLLKKKIAAFSAAFLLLFGLAVPQGARAAETLQPPALAAGAACLMDGQTGQVLLEKEMDTQLPPASITKIMTALLAVENAALTDTVTMTDNSVFSVPRDTSHLALTPGEELTMEQALMGTMLSSANDAANGVAETVGGTIEQFVEMMNRRAAEIGAVDTHFVNANGLDDAAHLTTARDMALITREAIQNETFLQIFSTVEYVIPPTNKQSEARNIGAGNKLVFDFTAYYYPEVIGAKSGYTIQAGHTLVSVAEKEGRTLICVVLSEPSNGDMYKDTVALLDYGFSAFSEVSLTARQLTDGIETNDAMLADDPPLTLLLAGDVSAETLTKRYQVEQGDQYGMTIEVTVSLPKETGLQYPVVGSTELRYVLPLAQTSAAESEEGGLSGGFQTVLKALALLAGVALGGFVLLLLYIRLRYDLRRAIRRWKRRSAAAASVRIIQPKPAVRPLRNDAAPQGERRTLPRGEQQGANVKRYQ